MRVLVCDQESELLEAVARDFDVDTATSKATCIDLMRANPFDVLVAGERLSDGSGLELLSHASSRWPQTLRVLVIEPARLRLLRGKLAPFGLHATLKYPIEAWELDSVLNRMRELMGDAEGEAAADEPAPPPAKATSKIRKVDISQLGARHSSPKNAASSTPPRAARASAPPAPAIRRKLGNYTPLGSPDDESLRIVAREFDATMAPLAARAVRTREEATRPRTPTEKLGELTTSLRDGLKRLLKR